MTLVGRGNTKEAVPALKGSSQGCKGIAQLWDVPPEKQED